MYAWIAPVVAGLGFVAWRSWRRDAAIKSGELLDVRELDASGATDAEIRALANRLYRVELQLELEPGASVDDGAIAELALLSADETGEGGGDPLHHATFAFREAVARATRAGLGAAPPGSGFCGAVPLLEFESDGLIRLRIDLAISEAPAIRKAHLVVKENVRRLSLGGGFPDRCSIGARPPI